MKGRINQATWGASLAFIIGILLTNLGFWKTLLVVIMTIIGWFAGKNYSTFVNYIKK